MNKVKKLFQDLKKEAIEKGLSEERIKLLWLIGIEAECGCPFADNLKKQFPELVQESEDM